MGEPVLGTSEDEFGPGGDTHHLIAIREDCDSRDAAPEVQLAIDMAS